MTNKGIHEDDEELYCNKCNKWLDKLIETLDMDEEVYCIYCDNWLCGEFDAWGKILKS